MIWYCIAYFMRGTILCIVYCAYAAMWYIVYFVYDTVLCIVCSVYDMVLYCVLRAWYNIVHCVRCMWCRVVYCVLRIVHCVTIFVMYLGAVYWSVIYYAVCRSHGICIVLYYEGHVRCWIRIIPYGAVYA